MKLAILTIVLDGMPFIARQLPIFQQLQCDWTWRIAEGAAKNTHCTSWCQKQKPRLSRDGTSEYIDSIEDERVTVYRKQLWDGKVEMFNTMLAGIDEPSVLLVVDSDEIWQSSQIETIVRLFTERPQLSSIMFACKFFVGPNLILRGEHCYGDHDYEWARAWRFLPGCRFASHEPPVLRFSDESTWRDLMGKEESRKFIGEFQHFAYATEAQCAFKQDFYSYPGLVRQWRALQRHFTNRPVGSTAVLGRFFPHVKGDLPEVVKI